MHEGLVAQIGTPQEVLEGDAADHLAATLGSDDAQSLVLGIRPEDLDLAAAPADYPSDTGRRLPSLGTGPCITAEPLGAETLYNIELGQKLVRVLRRETSVGFAEGSATRLHLTAEARLHFFTRATGRRRTGLVRRDDGSWQPEPTPTG